MSIEYFVTTVMKESKTYLNIYFCRIWVLRGPTFVELFHFPTDPKLAEMYYWKGPQQICQILDIMFVARIVHQVAQFP